MANANNGGLGSFGVPANATAVVLNVTVVNPIAPGFVTAYPTGATLPNASSIDYVGGQVVPNLVEVGIGTNGDVSFFSLVQSDLVVDVEGYTSPTASAGAGAGLYNALPSSVRICDTRAGNPSNLDQAPVNQCNGAANGGDSLTSGGSLNVRVAGANANDVIPSGATAAVFNVTVANPKAPGYLTVFPEDTTRPAATSNVDYGAGQVTTNRVIVPLSTTGLLPGYITVYSSAAADVIIDVSGYYSAANGSGSLFNAEAAPNPDLRHQGPEPVQPGEPMLEQAHCLGCTSGLEHPGVGRGAPGGHGRRGQPHRYPTIPAHLSHRVSGASDSLLFRPQSRGRRGTGQLGGGDGQSGQRPNFDPQRRRSRRRRGRCTRVVFVGISMGEWRGGPRRS